MLITPKAISGQVARCLCSPTVAARLFALPLAIGQIMMTDAAGLNDLSVTGGEDLLIS